MSSKRVCGRPVLIERLHCTAYSTAPIRCGVAFEMASILSHRVWGREAPVGACHSRPDAPYATSGRVGMHNKGKTTKKLLSLAIFLQQSIRLLMGQSTFQIGARIYFCCSTIPSKAQRYKGKSKGIMARLVGNHSSHTTAPHL
jgi:hypothetical protein